MTYDTYDAERLGQWSEPSVFAVEPAQVRAYAAATDEPSQAEGWTSAPPVFAILPAIDVYPGHVEQLFGHSLDELGSVHGEHDLVVSTPLPVPSKVSTRTAVVGVHVKPSGTAVVVATESFGKDGTVFNRQHAVQFLRRFDAGVSAGVEAPSWALRAAARSLEPIAEVRRTVTSDQSRRYAEASGDYGDYTLDDAAARAAGFPRPILHGACTMALAAQSVLAAVGADDPARLRRVGMRFSAPCFPGDELVTTVWELAEPADDAGLAFEVHDQDGRLLVANGVAEVTR
jgi:acyl dehydratase